MEDPQIIDLYFRRSEEAITRTAAKYGNYCFSIARNILDNREDSQEAVNDTYLACWNAIPPHRPSRFSAFLGKLTRRISINRALENKAQKRGGGQVDLALEELADCIPSPVTIEKALEEAELTALLNRFLRSLPKEERWIFVQRYWYLRSIAQLAEEMGYSQSKVKSMLFRTRNRLRSALETEGIFV